MWNWDYEEEGTNIRDGVRGTVRIILQSSRRGWYMGNY